MSGFYNGFGNVSGAESARTDITDIMVPGLRITAGGLGAFLDLTGNPDVAAIDAEAPVDQLLAPTEVVAALRRAI